MDASSISFAGFEWAVPALVLTVPGILIVIAVVVQAMIGLAWLPVARRSLDNDRRRRRPSGRSQLSLTFLRGARSSWPARSGHS